MLARVPSCAILKSARGEIAASGIQPGDSFIAYNPVTRQPGFITVSASKGEDGLKLGFDIAGYRVISVLPDTPLYTSGGPQPASNQPGYFLTFCPVNNMRMVTRQLVDVVEYGQTETVVLSWEGPGWHLWCEGLLVGSN